MNSNIIPNAGMAAPDFVATDTEGRTVRLSDLWAQQTLVVVFLRHLGCTFCRRHLVLLRKQYAAYRALGAEVVCVAMGGPKVGKAYQILFDLPFPILMLGDGDVTAYKQYGLGRGSLAQLFGPRMVIEGMYALLQLGARVIGRIVGDGRQLSGTFVIERGGTIRLAYRGKDAADNPPNQLLLESITKLQAGGIALEDKLLQQEAGAPI